MSIVLNEREFAQRVLEDCTLGHKPTETMSRLVRYYTAEGYSKREISVLLEEFLVKCDPSINVVKWQDTISRVIKLAQKLKLIEIDSIPITSSELDVCGKLQGRQSQRLMFTLIGLAKYANCVNPNNNSWVNRQDREIFRLANIITPIKRQSLMLGSLKDLGLIGFSRRIDNVNINVRCVDQVGEACLSITDFRNLGYQYMRYCGGPYFECESCGLVIKRTSNRQSYCHECSIEINRQRNLENWRQSIAG